MTACKECNSVFDSVEGFHRHLRKHKLRVKDYYERHYPKFCLLTNKKIAWKNGEHLEDYLSRDFINQDALIKYFASFEHQEAKGEWLLGFIEANCKRHGMAPSEVELETLQMGPNIEMFNKFVGFTDALQKIGHNARFDYGINYNGYQLPITKVPISEFCINIDTREQRPYEFFSSVLGKVDNGDYCLAGKHFNDVVVERKTPQDFGGTMGTGFERFERELARVREQGRYLILLIEYPASEIYNFRFYGRCQAGFLCHRLRELTRKYQDCMQAVFGGYRHNCLRLVPLFLLCGTKCKDIDLQYWVNCNRMDDLRNKFTENDLEELYRWGVK